MSRERFDFSGYKRESPFFDDRNNKVIGKMKDEAGGVPIVEFVSLKPKMYSYITDDGKEARRAKGVQRAVVARHLRHENYLKELRDPAENRFVNRRIMSHLHQLQTIAAEKRGLSAYDDKRFILADGIHSVAYGHESISDRLLDDDDEYDDEELDETEEDEHDADPLPETPEELEERAYQLIFAEDPELAEMYRNPDAANA